MRLHSRPPCCIYATPRCIHATLHPRLTTPHPRHAAPRHAVLLDSSLIQPEAEIENQRKKRVANNNNNNNSVWPSPGRNPSHLLPHTCSHDTALSSLRLVTHPSDDNLFFCFSLRFMSSETEKYVGVSFGCFQPHSIHGVYSTHL